MIMVFGEITTKARLDYQILVVKTLSDIGGLLLDGNQDVASLVVEALLRGIVTSCSAMLPTRPLSSCP
jgi:S-adenosylmethionine synthetase